MSSADAESFSGLMPPAVRGLQPSWLRSDIGADLGLDLDLRATLARFGVRHSINFDHVYDSAEDAISAFRSASVRDRAGVASSPQKRST